MKDIKSKTKSISTQSIKQIKGKMGEKAVVMWLKRKGYKVLDTNWMAKNKEIDIVTEYQNMLVFVEVKTHFGKQLDYPESAVNKQKQRSLDIAAQQYLKEKKINLAIRQDIIAVQYHPWGKQLLHIPDAFSSTNRYLYNQPSKLYF